MNVHCGTHDVIHDENEVCFRCRLDRGETLETPEAEGKRIHCGRHDVIHLASGTCHRCETEGIRQKQDETGNPTGEYKKLESVACALSALLASVEVPETEENQDNYTSISRKRKRG